MDFDFRERSKKELEELCKRPDEEIDFTDIPPITDEKGARAIPNKFYKPIKEAVSARIDADIVA